jgi:hypothetical protein
MQNYHLFFLLPLPIAIGIKDSYRLKFPNLRTSVSQQLRDLKKRSKKKELVFAPSSCFKNIIKDLLLVSKKTKKNSES